MSNLDTQDFYTIHLDLIRKTENEQMYFNLSDSGTSDFYIKITKDGLLIDLTQCTVTMYVVKPNKNSEFINLEYNAEKQMYYCNLPDNFKNISNKYKAQIAVYNPLTKETKITRSNFTYHVESDVKSEIEGGANQEEQENLLTELMSRLTSLEENGTAMVSALIDDSNTSTSKSYSSKKVEDIKKDIDAQFKDKANKSEIGSPLIATSISEMIDTSKVYVNPNDGNWYSWNGSEWSIGGVYNSIAIGNKSVTPEKTTFLKQTKNLFNKLEVKKGYYWNVSSGEQVNADFSYIKIQCEDGKKYIATGTSYNTIIFNSAGVKLGSDNNSNGMANCVISTEDYTNSSYFILNFRHAKYSIDTYMAVEGDVLPSEYIEYGFKFDGKILIDNDSNILKVKKDGTGDFTKVYDAIKYAEQYTNKNNVFDIHIYDTSTNYKGTSFDILEEMGGDSYLATITNTTNNQMGMPLKDYINLIGVGKVKLYAHLPDNCTLAQSTCFSTIDIFGEATLENLTIEIKNGRYAVHDESNNTRPNKKHRFKKCKFVHLGNKSGLWSAPHAYASGTSAGCIYEYEDCVFDSSASVGYPWDMHNYAPQLGSVISFNGCEMIKSSSQAVSMKFGFNGYSPVTTDPVAYETCFNDVYIKNVIANGTIQVAPEVSSYDCTNNYRLHNFTNITEDIKEDFIKS